MTALETRLKSIEEREKKATEGPWTTDYHRDGCTIDKGGEYIGVTNDREFFSSGLSVENCQQNADFIAHSRADVPFLLAAVKRLREGLALYRCPRCQDEHGICYGYQACKAFADLERMAAGANPFGKRETTACGP